MNKIQLNALVIFFFLNSTTVVLGSLNIRWEIETSYSSLKHIDNQLFIINLDSTNFLNMVNGVTTWTESGICLSISSDLIILLDGKTLLCKNIKDQSLVWKHDNISFNLFRYYDTNLYYSTTENDGRYNKSTLHSINPEQLSLNWSNGFSHGNMMPYATCKNYLLSPTCYYSNDYCNLLTKCIDIHNGETLWSYPGHPINCANDISLIRLFERNSDTEYIAAINSNTGSKAWEFKADIFITGTQKFIYLSDYNETTSTYILYCLNATNGTVLWQYQTPGFINTKPILHKNNLYMGSNENKIYCFNAKTGEIKWTFNINGFPVAASDDCLFIDDNGKLSCMIIHPVTVQHPFNTYAITSDDPSSIMVSL